MKILSNNISSFTNNLIGKTSNQFTALQEKINVVALACLGLVATFFCFLLYRYYKKEKTPAIKTPGEQKKEIVKNEKKVTEKNTPPSTKENHEIKKVNESNKLNQSTNETNILKNEDYKLKGRVTKLPKTPTVDSKGNQQKENISPQKNIVGKVSLTENQEKPKTIPQSDQKITATETLKKVDSSKKVFEANKKVKIEWLPQEQGNLEKPTKLVNQSPKKEVPPSDKEIESLRKEKELNIENERSKKPTIQINEVPVEQETMKPAKGSAEYVQKKLQINREFASQQQKAEEKSYKTFTLLKEDNIPEHLTFTKAFKGKPVKIVSEISFEEVLDKKVGISFCEGPRQEMEDAHLAIKTTITTKKESHQSFLYGIFDGHSGENASVYVRDNIEKYLKEEFNNRETLTDRDIWHALKNAFIRLNEAYTGDDGTTATIALVLNETVWVANVGDSRTILIKEDGTSIQASEDAKPGIERYYKQIEKFGGIVFNSQGTLRVQGTLAVARSIGDKRYVGETTKLPLISSHPKITQYPLADFKNGYLVLACDGLYDVATTNQVGKALLEMKETSPVEMAKRLVYSALKQNSQDNVSVLVAKL